MKSFLSSILVVVAVLGMTASFATVAQAGTIYAGWKCYPKQLDAHDLASGDLLTDFTPTGLSTKGMDVSPLDGYLYAVDSKTIRRYDPVTGTETGAPLATMGATTRGVEFDNAGNLYVATSSKYITKVAPGGSVDATWGGIALKYAIDLDIYGGKLYGGVSDGVVKWDMTTGAYEGYLLSGIQVDGVAFAPDGTLFTGHSYADMGSGLVTVRKWNSDYTTSEIVISADGYNDDSICDVDYYDGSVYGAGAVNVYRHVLGSGTFSTHIVHPTDYGWNGAVGGYIAIVPEPGTLAMLAGGLLGLLCYAWRKRKCAPR